MNDDDVSAACDAARVQRDGLLASVSIDDLVVAYDSMLSGLRLFSVAMRRQDTAFRCQVWLGLWQRGYGLSEIATVSGYSRERVRMILKSGGVDFTNPASRASRTQSDIGAADGEGR